MDDLLGRSISGRSPAFQATIIVLARFFSAQYSGNPCGPFTADHLPIRSRRATKIHQRHTVAARIRNASYSHPNNRSLRCLCERNAMRFMADETVLRIDTWLRSAAVTCLRASQMAEEI